LKQERLDEIFFAKAFQCHKTLPHESHGTAEAENPQQCAGLMAILAKEKRPNVIMKIALATPSYTLDLDAFDPKNETYDSMEEAKEAHGRFKPKV